MDDEPDYASLWAETGMKPWELADAGFGFGDGGYDLDQPSSEYESKKSRKMRKKLEKKRKALETQEKNHKSDQVEKLPKAEDEPKIKKAGSEGNRGTGNAAKSTEKVVEVKKDKKRKRMGGDLKNSPAEVAKASKASKAFKAVNVAELPETSDRPFKKIKSNSAPKTQVAASQPRTKNQRRHRNKKGKTAAEPEVPLSPIHIYHGPNASDLRYMRYAEPDMHGNRHSDYPEEGREKIHYYQYFGSTNGPGRKAMEDRIKKHMRKYYAEHPEREDKVDRCAHYGIVDSEWEGEESDKSESEEAEDGYDYGEDEENESRGSEDEGNRSTVDEEEEDEE